MSETILVVAGVIERDKQILISFRDASKSQGNRWEFPGGKIEQGETAYQALQRELYEELAIKVLAANELETISHQYDNYSVELMFWSVTEFTGEPKSAEGQLIQWCHIEDLNQYEFPDANYQIMKRLMN